MHASSSAKKAALLFLILLLNSLPANSESSGEVNVKNAETSLLGDDYILSADIDYQLSKKATEALKNGVPLLWTYQFKVEELRELLWNKTILEKNILYRIQYHALLNVYRVKNESNGSVNNFSTLQTALDLLSTLRDYRLIESSKILDSKTYLAKIKISFERDALPLPLRPIAYLNSQWYLSSDWYVWPLKK
jgi:Domain of unknown function (DUF4390)